MKNENYDNDLIVENEKKLRELSEEYFFLSKTDTTKKTKVFEEIMKIQDKLAQLKKATS